MATSTGDSASHVRWGEFGLEVEGTLATLVVYRGTDSDDFFLPFRDETSGEATYSGERYLDLIEAAPWWISTTLTILTALITPTGAVHCRQKKIVCQSQWRVARSPFRGR